MDCSATAVVSAAAPKPNIVCTREDSPAEFTRALRDDDTVGTRWTTEGEVG